MLERVAAIVSILRALLHAFRGADSEHARRYSTNHSDIKQPPSFRLYPTLVPGRTATNQRVQLCSNSSIYMSTYINTRLHTFTSDAVPVLQASPTARPAPSASTKTRRVTTPAKTAEPENTVMRPLPSPRTHARNVLPTRTRVQGADC